MFVFGLINSNGEAPSTPYHQEELPYGGCGISLAFPRLDDHQQKVNVVTPTESSSVSGSPSFFTQSTTPREKNSFFWGSWGGGGETYEQAMERSFYESHKEVPNEVVTLSRPMTEYDDDNDEPDATAIAWNPRERVNVVETTTATPAPQKNKTRWPSRMFKKGKRRMDDVDTPKTPYDRWKRTKFR